VFICVHPWLKRLFLPNEPIFFLAPVLQSLSKELKAFQGYSKVLERKISVSIPGLPRFSRSTWFNAVAQFEKFHLKSPSLSKPFQGAPSLFQEKKRLFIFPAAPAAAFRGRHPSRQRNAG